MAKRKSTMITNEKEIDYILNLSPKECQKLGLENYYLTMEKHTQEYVKGVILESLESIP